MMMKILQGGEQMGMGGFECKDNDGINCYLGHAGMPGPTSHKATANVRMVSDLKAMLAAQFDDESKKYVAQKNNNNNDIIKEEVIDHDHEVNKLLYPSLGIEPPSSQPSHPSQPIDMAGGGGVHVSSGGGLSLGNGSGSGKHANKNQQRVVLRGSHDSLQSKGSKGNKSRRSNRMSMGKQQLLSLSLSLSTPTFSPRSLARLTRNTDNLISSIILPSFHPLIVIPFFNPLDTIPSHCITIHPLSISTNYYCLSSYYFHFLLLRIHSFYCCFSVENIANAFSIRRVGANIRASMDMQPLAGGGGASIRRVGTSPHATLRFHAGKLERNTSSIVTLSIDATQHIVSTQCKPSYPLIRLLPPDPVSIVGLTGGIIRDELSSHHLLVADANGLRTPPTRDNSRHAQFETGMVDMVCVMSKFSQSQNHSQSYCASPGGRSHKKGPHYLYGLEGVLDDLEEEERAVQQTLEIRRQV